MRRGRTWHWTRMRPFLARFSESVWSGHLASWADFITTTSELKFLVHTRVLGTLDPATYSVTGESYYAGGGRPVRKKLLARVRRWRCGWTSRTSRLRNRHRSVDQGQQRYRRDQFSLDG